MINVQDFNDLALIDVYRESLPPCHTKQQYWDCKSTAKELSKHLRHWAADKRNRKSNAQCDTMGYFEVCQVYKFNLGTRKTDRVWTNNWTCLQGECGPRNEFVALLRNDTKKLRFVLIAQGPGVGLNPRAPGPWTPVLLRT